MGKMVKANSVLAGITANGKTRNISSSVLKVLTDKRVLWIGSPIVIIIIWETVARLGVVAPYILPAPTDIAKTGVELLGNGVLLKHTIASLKRALPAFFIGSFSGILLGLMMG